MTLPVFHDVALADGQYFSVAIQREPFFRFSAVRVKNIPMRFSVGSIVSDNGMPFITDKGFVLNPKLGNLITLPGMVMAIAIEAFFWVEINDKFAFADSACSGQKYNTNPPLILISRIAS